MKRTIFLSFIIFSNIHLFAVWDFEFCAGVNPIQVTIQSVSIPFEGHNNPNLPGINRPIGQIFNGYEYRRFDVNNNYFQKNITYHQNSEICFRLSSCFYETPPIGEFEMWGFAKYLITVVNTNNPSETFRFYWNSLDSKMGTDSWKGRDYHCDWSFEVIDNIPTEHYISIFSEVNEVERVYLSQQYKEVKLWKLLYPAKPNPEEPWEKNFQARTTPFPIRPEAFFAPLFLTGNFELGTTVTIDNIYNNTGSLDRYGYNTEISYPSNYYTNPPIPAGEPNVQGKTVTTPAYPDAYANYLNLTAESGNKLILKPDIKLWISGIPSDGGDKIQFKSGSTLRLEANSEIRCCFEGQLIIDGGTILELNNPSYQYCHQASIIKYNGGTHTINNNGTITILNGGTLELSANTKLVFDGVGSRLKLVEGSQVILGNGASIEFNNGANIDAYGSVFSCPSGNWNSINFKYSGSDIIRNCTFSNAPKYLDFDLDETSSVYPKIIEGNTFNNGTVKLVNPVNLQFNSNTFNCSTISGTPSLLEVTHNLSSLPPNPVLNIVKNNFIGGTIQLRLTGFAASSVPYYVKGNRFEGANSNGRIGFYANQVRGSFKQNNFADNNFQNSVYLSNSNIDMLLNVLNSQTGHTVNLAAGSTANMAPLVNGSQLIMYGGLNMLNLHNSNTQSANMANCTFDYGSSVLLDKGRNCLTFTNINPNYHIIGNFNSMEYSVNYAVTRNTWSPNIPKNLFNMTVNLIYQPDLMVCAPTTLPDFIENAEIDITDMGGISDTVYIITDEDAGGGAGGGGSISSINEDIPVYSMIIMKKKAKDYSGSIIKSKYLIDNYDSSKYLPQAIDELYACYNLTDTTGNQSNTNALFTELKAYLDQKIAAYSNNPAVTEKLYGYYLMSLVKLRQFTQAIAGYENIMNNHPDPVVRLNASWNRAAVILLMNGQGGGLSNITRKTKKPGDKRPDKIARDVFKSSKKLEERDENVKLQQYSKEEKRIIGERVIKFNPSTQKEFDEKVSSDLVFMIGLNTNKIQDHNSNNVPNSYRLYQNYPNPFNPQTTIKYDIPKDNIVLIKLYDILGREVFKMDEFKKAGSYEMMFDGSGFASGIYFYSIESGNFKDTKKMVLLK